MSTVKMYGIEIEKRNGDRLVVNEHGYLGIVDLLLYTLRKYNIKAFQIKSLKVYER